MLAIIIAGFVSILVVAWYWYRRNQLRLREQIGLSGPPPSFFLGNIVDIQSAKTELEKVNMFSLWRKEYGDVFGFYFGPLLSVVSFDLDLLKEAFIKKSECFVDRRIAIRDPDSVGGQSIIQLTGREWKEVREVVSPVFSSGKIKQMSAIVHDKTDTLMDQIRNHAKQAKQFDFYDGFKKLTLAVIGKTAFAMDTKCQEDNNDPFMVNCKQVFDNLELTSNITTKLIVMFPEFQPFLVKLAGSSPFMSAREWLVGGLRHVLEQRKLNFKSFKGIDILQILLQRTGIKEEMEPQDNPEALEHVVQKKARSNISDDVVLGNSLTFLLAGYETTSTALGFTAWLLAKHQTVQQRLCQEIDRRLSITGKSEVVFDDLREMPYLDAVFHESLRYYPPVTGFVSRLCVKECTLDGIQFTPGMEIIAPVYSIHHDPDVWAEPDVFEPERFMGPRDYHQMAWIPFGSGPRHCIGLRFAEMEYKLALTKVLSEFTIQVPEDGPEELDVLHAGILFRPASGVWLKASARR